MHIILHVHYTNTIHIIWLIYHWCRWYRLHSCTLENQNAYNCMQDIWRASMCMCKSKHHTALHVCFSRYNSFSFALIFFCIYDASLHVRTCVHSYTYIRVHMSCMMSSCKDSNWRAFKTVWCMHSTYIIALGWDYVLACTCIQLYVHMLDLLYVN